MEKKSVDQELLLSIFVIEKLLLTKFKNLIQNKSCA